MAKGRSDQIKSITTADNIEHIVVYDKGSKEQKKILKDTLAADLVTNGKGYLEYLAVLNQTNTDAPTAVELINEIGTVTYSYIAAGNYLLVCTGAFANEMYVTYIINQVDSGKTAISYDTEDTLYIQSWNAAGVSMDDRIYGTTLHIKIFTP